MSDATPAIWGKAADAVALDDTESLVALVQTLADEDWVAHNALIEYRHRRDYSIKGYQLRHLDTGTPYSAEVQDEILRSHQI